MSTLAEDLAAAADPVTFASGLGFTAEAWQERLLRSRARRVLLICCRQAGKSTTIALRALHMATYRPASLTLLFAPTQRQSDELLTKIRSFYRMLGRAKAAKDNGSELILSNGSRIISLPGSESSTRGFSAADLLVLDEAARASDDLLASCLPMVSSTGTLIVASTPFGKDGFFFRLADDERNGYERHKITAYESAQYTPGRIAEVKGSLSSYVFASDYECSFEDTDAQLFGTELVRAAMSPTIQPLEI